MGVDDDAETRVSRPLPPKPSMGRTFLFMMFFLTLFVLVDPNLRDAFGRAAAAVFWPTIGFGAAYPVLTILLAGTLTTTISSLVRHFFTDWVKQTRINKQDAALRKATMEALRQGNRTKVTKLREVQTSMQAETLSVRFAPMKSMAVTFLLFILVFSWLGQFVYADVLSAGTVFFAVPWQTQTDLRAGYVFPAWILLYSLLAIPIGQIVTRVLKFVSFRKRLAAMGSEAAE
jgi:uncharacterized membrane protein (DUF106 family)